MELENIIVNEKITDQEDKYHMLTLTCESKLLSFIHVFYVTVKECRNSETNKGSISREYKERDST